MKKLLKISEVAQITGLSVNGIRYYEREGVVQPIYRGKYRYYDISATSALLRAANYRSMGFSLPAAAQLAHCTDVDELQTSLLRQRQTVEEEIAEKQRVLDAIENRVRQLNEIKLQYGRCSLVDGPAYYMMPELPWNNGSIDVPEGAHARDHFYTKCGPAAAPAVLIPLKELNGSSDILAAFTGPGIPASALPAALSKDFQHDPSIRRFCSQLCIYTVFLIEDGTTLRRISFSYVFDYAAQQNLTFSGDAYTYRIAAIKEKNSPNAGVYVQAWFPVDKK